MMNQKELCKALTAIKQSYAEIIPNSKKEKKHIEWGIDILNQAIIAIKALNQYSKATKETIETISREHLHQDCDICLQYCKCNDQKCNPQYNPAFWGDEESRNLLKAFGFDN